MRKIEVDDEVYAYLEGNVSSFFETPNQILRRILHLDKTEVSPPKLQRIQKRRKKPKTNLSDLVKAGLLQENQKLFLHDYQGNKIAGYEATFFQGSLIWKNQSYSMSELAKILLKEQGYASDSVRGPAHWFTSDGISIKDIWESFLRKI